MTRRETLLREGKIKDKLGRRLEIRVRQRYDDAYEEKEGPIVYIPILTERH